MSSNTQTKLNFSTLVEESNSRIAEIKSEQDAPISAKSRNVVFGLMAVGGLMFAGAMVLQIITGIFALIFTVVAAVGLFLGLRFLKSADPLIKQWTRNIVLAKMIENAKKYKIETLTNLVIQSESQLKNARKARDKMKGYVNKVKQRLAESDKNATSYSQKLAMTEKVEQAYEIVEKNVEKAGLAHKNLKLKVDDYKDMAEFTDMASEALQFASANSGNQLEEMLGMEAFAAIESEFHEAMASIDNSVRDFEIDSE